MTRDQIIDLIKQSFTPTIPPTLCKVTYNNGRIQDGYFLDFADIKTLKDKGQYRFIPVNSALALEVEFNNTSKYNTDHSIIINADEIQNIELVQVKIGKI